MTKPVLFAAAVAIRRSSPRRCIPPLRALQASGCSNPKARRPRTWPRWRGPSGQGLVSRGRVPGPVVRDRDGEMEGPGAGSGQFLADCLGRPDFLTTAHDGGQRLSVLAFRRADGAQQWETFVPSEGVESGHRKNGHASATPVTDGERVYASFGTHGLVAIDMKGRLVWRAAIAPLDNYHGSAGSPVLYGESVIIYHDAGAASFVGAFDRKTGKPRWRIPRRETVGWGTPIVIRAGERDELIVSSQQRVYAYDPATGATLWTVSGNTFEVVPTPLVAHDLLFCSSGRAGPTLAIRPGGSGDVTATHVAWSTPRGSPFVPSGVVVGDVLYLVNDMQSVLSAFEAKTGRLLFQDRLGEARREGFSSSPVAVGGKVFFTNDEGETFVLEAGREFNLLHVNRLGEPIYASPALVDGRWYFRSASSLVAIGR